METPAKDGATIFSPPLTLAQNGADPETSPSTTTTSAHTSAQDVEMTSKEEDNLLDGDPATDEKTLLALGQKFKKAKCNLIRVDSHLSFIETCKGRGMTPKGLRVCEECNALLADYTMVRQKFKCTTVTAQCEYTEVLRDHYTTTKEKLQEELRAITTAMDRKASTATTTVREEHQQLCKKTEENIKKQEDRLEQTKRKKFEILGQQSSRTSRQERGMNYNNTGSQRSRTNYSTTN